MTYSRITRIKEFFDSAKNAMVNKVTEFENNEYYRKTINEQLKKVIFACGPAYFFSCYVQSLNENEKDEKEVRDFLLRFYEELVNSKDEDKQKQFYTFVDLVNQEIDKYQEYKNISPEKKSFLRNNKFIVNQKTTSSTKVRATETCYFDRYSGDWIEKSSIKA